MRCIIIQDEISEEECCLVQQECYKEKNGKELPKKVKRIVGWGMICKTCRFHEKPDSKKKK